MARTSSSSAKTSMRSKLLARQPAPDDTSELFALVFLQGVTAAHDRRVRLSGAPRHLALERPVAAARDRVLIREGSEERLVPGAQRLPRVAVVVGGGIFGRRRHQHWELPGAGLV